MTDTEAKPRIITGIPYDSGEARTRACTALDAGRLAHGHERVNPPSFPPIDNLLFQVGLSREGYRALNEDAHAALPETLASRKLGGSDERSMGDRIRLLLALFDRRVTELLDANNREVERRRAAEAALASRDAEISRHLRALAWIANKEPTFYEAAITATTDEAALANSQPCHHVSRTGEGVFWPGGSGEITWTCGLCGDREIVKYSAGSFTYHGKEFVT